jgi:hypothetical protein
VWVAVTWDAEITLAFPILVSGLPLIARNPLLRVVLRWIALVLLILFDLLAMLSVWRLFVPATVAMVLLASWATIVDVNGDEL